MTKRSPPPINESLIDENGSATAPWALFFNSTYIGDTGTAWTPTFVSLGQTGTPTITGIYFKLTQRLVYFRVVVTPATDTTSTAGTTYIENFPLTFSANGVCFAAANNLGAIGAITATGNRIYTPGWSAVNVPVTVTGFGEAR